MKFANLFTLIFFFSLFCGGCGSKSAQNSDGTVTSELVNNPATASGSGDASNMPAIEFEEPLFDFGKVIQGEKVKHAYRFKNTGKFDLVIVNASGSCGCTIPTWPKEPIRPGEQGIVEVVFNSTGRLGWQAKKIRVSTNAIPNLTIVDLVGEVIVPKNDSIN